MTSKQTAFFVAVLLLGTSAVWYEHQRGLGFHQQIAALRARELSPESEAALARERDEARAGLQRVAAETKALQAGRADLLKLRGEATVLRSETRGNGPLSGANGAGKEPVAGGVPAAMLATLAANVASLKEALQKSPAQQVPELALLEEADWIRAAHNAKMDTEDNVVRTLSRARTLAKEKLIPMMSQALHGYVAAHDGQLPTALTELLPYFEPAVEASMFDRYTLAKTGDSRNLGPGDMVIREKDRLTPHDSVFRLGLHGWGSNSPDDE